MEGQASKTKKAEGGRKKQKKTEKAEFTRSGRTKTISIQAWGGVAQNGSVQRKGVTHGGNQPKQGNPLKTPGDKQ